MKCPRCRHELDEGLDCCPACGLDLMLTRSLDDLQGEMANTVRLISDQLRQMKMRLDRVSEALMEGGQAHSTAGPVTALAEQESTPPTGTPTPEEHNPAKQDKTTTHTAIFAENGEITPTQATKAGAVSLSGATDEREMILGQRWLLIAGVAITLFGIGYFLKYSADHEWIGPAGQLGLAYLAGVAATAVGELFRVRERFRNFGLPIVGGGIAVAYFTTFAGYQLYEPAVLGTVAAFSILVFVTMAACVLALAHDSIWLAVLGLVGGFLAPMLFESVSRGEVALMSYMAVLNLGILAIASFKRWRLLTILAFTCTWFLFSVWFLLFYEVQALGVTLFFSNLFFLVYALGPFLFYLAHPSPSGPIGSFVLVALDSVIAFAFGYIMLHKAGHTTAASGLSAGYAALFMGMAWILRVQTRPRVRTSATPDPGSGDGAVIEPPREAARFLDTPLVLGIIFCALTVAFLLNGYWVTIGWGFLSIAVLWLGARLGTRNLLWMALWLCLLALSKLVFHDYSDLFGFELDEFFTGRVGRFQDQWPGRWLTTAVCLAALLVQSRALRRLDRDGRGLQLGLAVGLLVTFVVLLFGALNLEVSAFFYTFVRTARHAAVSVLWAFYAVGLMIWGFLSNLSILRKSAMGLFAATLIKIFALDMAYISTPFRILSFMVLGILLIGMSYLYYRYRERL